MIIFQILKKMSCHLTPPLHLVTGLGYVFSKAAISTWLSLQSAHNPTHSNTYLHIQTWKILAVFVLTVTSIHTTTAANILGLFKWNAFHLTEMHFTYVKCILLNWDVFHLREIHFHLSRIVFHVSEMYFT